jgi:hypothetical protein
MLALKPVLAKNNIRIGDFLSSVLESAIAEYLETQGVADIPRPLQGVPLARKPNPRSKKLSLAD